MRGTVPVELPRSANEAATLLADARRAGLRVRVRGGGTKLDWGRPVPAPGLELGTERMGGLIAHNAADLTAEVEAGMRLAEAQAAFAEVGQMLALDPPLGAMQGATIGGVVAAADSGPLRHRYGGPRDLLLGMTVVLPDGTVSQSGGTVIKNVAGYDLAKLFAGSFGTLGMISRVAVRLHPLPIGWVTAVGTTEDPSAARRAVAALTRLPLELESLDLRADATGIDILARVAGAAPEPRAARAADSMQEAGLDAGLRVSGQDVLWDRQRAGQRSAAGTVIRVSGLPSELPRVLEATSRAKGILVGRAGLGISWITMTGLADEEVAALIRTLRADLEPMPCVLCDAPIGVRRAVDPWGPLDPLQAALSRRLKDAFDPSGVMNPGIFAGGV